MLRIPIDQYWLRSIPFLSVTEITNMPVNYLYLRAFK